MQICKRFAASAMPGSLPENLGNSTSTYARARAHTRTEKDKTYYEAEKLKRGFLTRSVSYPNNLLSPHPFLLYRTLWASPRPLYLNHYYNKQFMEDQRNILFFSPHFVYTHQSIKKKQTHNTHSELTIPWGHLLISTNSAISAMSMLPQLIRSKKNQNKAHLPWYCPFASRHSLRKYHSYFFW